MVLCTMFSVQQHKGLRLTLNLWAATKAAQVVDHWHGTGRVAQMKDDLLEITSQ